MGVGATPRRVAPGQITHKKNHLIRRGAPFGAADIYRNSILINKAHKQIKARDLLPLSLLLHGNPHLPDRSRNKLRDSPGWKHCIHHHKPRWLRFRI